MAYYAVAIGKKPGIYTNKTEWNENVYGFEGAVSKECFTLKEARQFIKENKVEEKPIEVIKMVDNLNTEQYDAFQELLSGRNVFLTGNAGTGKTYVMKSFIEYMSQYKNVLVCAPTWIAASNLSGITIHRAFGVPFQLLPETPLSRVRESLKVADIIIIDEISMCSPDVFSYVCKMIKKAGNIVRPKQIIVVGDFFQLPPIIEMKSGLDFAFECDEWQELNFSTFILKQSMRQQDNEFYEELNKIRIGDSSSIDYFNKNCATNERMGILVASYNQSVDQKNAYELSLVDAPSVLYKGYKDKSFTGLLPTMMDFEIKIGARVMVLINDVDTYTYQNGSLATVVETLPDSVNVRLDSNDEIINFPFYTWKEYDYFVEGGRLKQKTKGKFIQIPLKLAYAITVHKSQGQTYDYANIDPDTFVSGQLYVALSRVKAIENLYLTRTISSSDLKVSKKVARFYFDEQFG